VGLGQLQPFSFSGSGLLQARPACRLCQARHAQHTWFSNLPDVPLCSLTSTRSLAAMRWSAFLTTSIPSSTPEAGSSLDTLMTCLLFRLGAARSMGTALHYQLREAEGRTAEYLVSWTSPQWQRCLGWHRCCGRGAVLCDMFTSVRVGVETCMEPWAGM
jgi:hypothetical protein